MEIRTAEHYLVAKAIELEEKNDNLITECLRLANELAQRVEPDELVKILSEGGYATTAKVMNVGGADVQVD